MCENDDTNENGFKTIKLEQTWRVNAIAGRVRVSRVKSAISCPPRVNLAHV